jgi:V/A-type H+-transporting ATPase subunit I
LGRFSKLFLNKPDVAVKTYIVVPVDEVRSLLDELVRRSILEPLPAGDVRREVERLEARLEIAGRTEKMVQELSSRLRSVVEVEVKELPWDLDEGLMKLHNELQETMRIVKALEEESSRLEGTLEKLVALRMLLAKAIEAHSTNIILDYEGSLVAVKTLYGPAEDLKKIEEKSLETFMKVETQPGKLVIQVVFERKTYDELRDEISQFEVGVKALGSHDAGELVALVEKQVDDLGRRVEEVREKIVSIVASKAYEIALAKIIAEDVLSKIGILREARESKYLTVIAGWTLKSKVPEVERIVRERKGVLIAEDAPDPPVEFNNLKPFKPFELFTEIMGYPSPYEWDPTPLLTYLYLVFFSLMFPDVGYAIGLIIGSRLVLPYFVENKETLSKLVKIATFAGITGIITGVLSGSFFGSLLGQYISAYIPPVLPSLPPRLAALEDIGRAILSYIGLALMVGYFMVLLAHGVGFYKNIVFRNKVGIGSEAIIITLMLFAPPAIKTVLGFNVDVLGLLKLLPGDICVKIALSLLVAYAVFRSLVDKPFGALLWIFDVLGVMADTLSFVRIAGIAIGSAIMAELLNSLIASTTSALAGASIVAFVVGFIMAISLHIVNLGLSSISPFVHSLRLIMYEVSSKFYEGSGRRITPAGVKARVVKIGTPVK